MRLRQSHYDVIYINVLINVPMWECTDVPMKQPLMCRILVDFGLGVNSFANLLIIKFANHKKCLGVDSCTVSPDRNGNELMC